jgi:RNA recognition motif-containing protein
MSYNKDLQICVKCLPSDIQREELYKIFTKLGKIKIFLINPQDTRTCRTAFITFDNSTLLNKALLLNGITYRKSVLLVEKLQKNAVKGRICPHVTDCNDNHNSNYNFQYNSKVDTRLVTSEQGWKPSRDNSVIGDIRDLINKITDKTADKLTSILEDMILKIDDNVLLEQAIKVIFSKIIMENVFCSLYAKMCKKISSQSNFFKRTLLNLCQETFENDEKEIPSDMIDHVLIAEFKNKEKLKVLGNIRFIGELFKIGMIPEMIIHGCISKLLSSKVDDMGIEQLCNFLTNVGPFISKDKKKLDSYFESLDILTASDCLSNRIKFMILDVISLKSSGWKMVKKENKSVIKTNVEEVKINTEAVKMMFEEFFETEELEALTYGLEQDFKVEQYAGVFAHSILEYCNSSEKIEIILQVLIKNSKELSLDVKAFVNILSMKVELFKDDLPKLSNVVKMIISKLSLNEVLPQEKKEIKVVKAVKKNDFKNVKVIKCVKKEVKVVRKTSFASNNGGFKVFVKRLPFNLERKELFNIFSGLGKLKIFMINNKDTQKFSGMCIITFETKHFAEKALDLDGIMYNKKEISVEYSRD